MIATSSPRGIRVTGTTYTGTADATTPTDFWGSIGYSIDELADAFINLKETVRNFVLEWKDIFAMFWDWVQSFKGRQRTKRNRRRPCRCVIGAKPASDYG